MHEGEASAVLLAVAVSGQFVLEKQLSSMNLVLESIARMLNAPVPGTANDGWLFGDMQVVLHLFGKMTDASPSKEWPFSRDVRQGTVPGLRALPAFRQQSDAELAKRRAAMEALGKKAWKPKNRIRSVSTALRAYAAHTTSAARGAVRVVPEE